MSVADTNTQLLRPRHVTEETLNTPDGDAAALVRAALAAERQTLELEDARPLPRVVPQQVHRPRPGRHRAPEVPLPSRERGAALAAAQSRSRVAWLQTAIMRTQLKLRAAGFIRGGEQ
jgi:hypothetical protein